MTRKRSDVAGAPFSLEETYDAPIQRVWRALTDATSMKAWYFPQVDKFEPAVGFTFAFKDDGSPYQKEWIVTRVETARLLAHSWNYRGYPGRSEVTFELCDVGEKTLLRLTHTGIESFPDDPHFARHRFVDGWNQLLGSNLRRFLDK